MPYKPIYWASPIHYIGTNGTHIRDFWLDKSTAKSRFMAALHKLLGKRDPFFHRRDYF